MGLTSNSGHIKTIRACFRSYNNHFIVLPRSNISHHLYTTPRIHLQDRKYYSLNYSNNNIIINVHIWSILFLLFSQRLEKVIWRSCQILIIAALMYKLFCSQTVKLFFTDPRLFWKVVFDSCTPYQFRIHGPNAWSGARDAIFSQWERTLYHLKTRPLGFTPQSKSNTPLLVLFVVGAVCIAILLQKL